MAEPKTTEPKLTNDGISSRGEFNDPSNAVPQSRWQATSYSKNGTDGKMMAKGGK